MLPLRAMSLLVSLIPESGPSRTASATKASVHHPKSGRELVSKLIGARVYTTDSARDTEGHGSHTASTAAGNNVVSASFYGFAEGTARGGVPSARIATYKACNGIWCTSDILAAFDDTIADGVDLITVPLGSVFMSEFYSDPVATGAFHAAEKGVLVVQSAGNSGLAGFQSVASVAPWILSVAASTTDRHFVAAVDYS
ncbi:hypothetical protein ERO13_D08G009500v2 [Gossypium hirsutum]|nr:hypothetical protein ERO13_D08G009500v2 [Gossypium hirsutum]